MRRFMNVGAVGAAVAVALALLVPLVPAHAAAGIIGGVAYDDADRDGVRGSGEAPFPNHRIYLFDAARTTFLATTLTDADGRYVFSGLADGAYAVDYESGSWSAMKADWVPTTTATLRPRHDVTLRSVATADFGWRRILRSTNPDAPLSSTTMPNGTVVESYNDAVTAGTIASALEEGTLLGDEGTRIRVRFDLAASDNTSTAVTGTPGTFTNYSALVYVTYNSWLSSGTRTLFHEYGHAWGHYFDLLVQQDGTLRGYLEARGVDGDPRVGSTYSWNPDEMIAEDYRQLFGSPAAQTATQMNREIPPAAEVAGLRDYLAGAFRQPPAAESPAGEPSAPEVALAVEGLQVNPQKITKSGTVGFELSKAASVVVEVRTTGGQSVRVVADGARPAGPIAETWDRTDAKGRRVKSGTYLAVVTASVAGDVVTASATFQVG